MSVLKNTQHDLLNSAPGDWDCRHPFSLKFGPWRRRHQYLQRTWVLCNSGVLFKERTWSHSSSHSINFIIAQIGKKEQEVHRTPVHRCSPKYRIKSITLGANALDQSCSADTAVGFAPTGSSKKTAKQEQLSLPASREKAS